jgi:hypothetical protein
MSMRPWLTAILWCLGGLAFADTPAPLIPDTPAGHTLALWLEAFNSGERAGLESFINTYFPGRLEAVVHLRTVSGGYDLLSIEASEPTDLTFRVKEKASSNQLIGRIKVVDAEPAVISYLRLLPVPPGARFEKLTLDSSKRARLIDEAARILDEFYVFPDTAKKAATALRARERQGKYKDIVDGDDFATRLTDDLQEVSHDKHLRVRFSPVLQPAGEPERGPEAQAVLRGQLATINCGFEKAEHLPPNIGYLKFNTFADTDICAPTAIAAMNFLADSDVLILDLRDNHGGRPDMVTFMASYLFDEPTHLNDNYNRKENTTRQTWSLPYVPGRKFIGSPVFVLTSRATFSGAEEFCYDLKMLKRVTLIGEPTGGGAHLIESHRIDAHFSIDVPLARAINPVSKTDWEGTGVEPDIRVPAADALTEALKRASQQPKAN